MLYIFNIQTVYLPIPLGFLHIRNHNIRQILLHKITVTEISHFLLKSEKDANNGSPLPEHVKQVHCYAEDTLRKFPNYKVRMYVVYICANRGWRYWEVYLP
ncbi:hypothetical protein [Bacteroides nordii]|uniref:hypothetical protein n=1 Tax=Bacteroides nordii TaxID=291645 RepID=UPI00189D245A|nr:hypothetical protein [Bacteroides nordii]